MLQSHISLLREAASAAEVASWNNQVCSKGLMPAGGVPLGAESPRIQYMSQVQKNLCVRVCIRTSTIKMNALPSPFKSSICRHPKPIALHIIFCVWFPLILTGVANPPIGYVSLFTYVIVNVPLHLILALSGPTSVVLQTTVMTTDYSWLHQLGNLCHAPSHVAPFLGFEPRGTLGAHDHGTLSQLAWLWKVTLWVPPWKCLCHWWHVCHGLSTPI